MAAITRFAASSSKDIDAGHKGGDFSRNRLRPARRRAPPKTAPEGGRRARRHLSIIVEPSATTFRLLSNDRCRPGASRDSVNRKERKRWRDMQSTIRP
jgi:hypothetical protein